MKIYCEFVKNYNKAIEAYNKCIELPSFNMFLEVTNDL